MIYYTIKKKKREIKWGMGEIEKKNCRNFRKRVKGSRILTGFQ